MRKTLQLCSLALLLSAGAACAAKAAGGVAVPLKDDPTYKVVVNQEKQHSIWPADRENPLGWNDVGKSGTKEECLAYINKILEGMRPTTAGSNKPETAPRANTLSPNDFQIPSLGQNGRAVEIKGPFDGDIRTTEIRIGGQPVTALAESSRSCFFISPTEKLGLIEITIRENSVEARGTYRNIGVRLSAPKTNLLKGERTVVTVIVEGLNGIQENIPLLLEKKGNVSMEGGDVQTVPIRPNDVVIEGTQSRADVRKVIVGLQPGFFNITATVIDPARRPIIIPLHENGGVNGYRVKKDGTSFMINLENVRDPLKGDPVDGKHKLEYRCPQLSQLPYVSSLFINRGVGKMKAECLILVTPRIIVQDEN